MSFPFPTRLLLFAALAGVLVPLPRACAQPQSPAAHPAGALAARFDQLLRRSSDGHSPTPEDVAAAGTFAEPVDAAALREALPFIEKALENSDAPVRTFALTALAGLQVPPTAAPEPAAAPAATPSASADPNAPSTPPAQTVAPPPPGPSTYKPEIERVLAPAVPTIAAHLTEDVQPNRVLTATILGGFTPNPPAAVYPPLLAYLKRDDAIGPVGLQVVTDLLQLGPLSSSSVEGITRYLRRSDETPDSRANLVDAIALSPNQSQTLNKSLLVLLDSDDPSLRARLILSLPPLDLAPDVFADTRERVAQLAANDQENLQVVNAAKAVAPCWTRTRMSSGCPVYQ